MAQVTTLTRKGQLTIPKDVRQQLGLQPFDKIEVEVAGNEARLRKAHPSLTEIAGILPALGVPVEEMAEIAKRERTTRRQAGGFEE